MQLTPLKTHVLNTLVATQQPRLVKCRGGFRPASGPGAEGTVINIRTVRALEADKVLSLDDPMFPNEACLTPRGVDVVREIYPGNSARSAQVEQLAKAVLS